MTDLNNAGTGAKRFKKNDAAFVCGHCGRGVEPLGYSSRNHCPFCLWSLHVDENPGDRANECRGLMEPVKVELDSKKGYVIVHRCTKCGVIKRNRAANEAKVQPDSMKLIIELSARGF